MSKLKNELMFKDESAIVSNQNELSIASAKLNEYLQIVRNFFGNECEIDFSNLLNLSNDDLKNVLRKKFPFPNSTDEFNYEALGMNPGSVFTFYNRNASKWNKFNFEYKEGKFIPAKKQSEIDSYFYYADTEERKRICDLINRTNILLKELRDSKLYNPSNSIFEFDSIKGLNSFNASQFRFFLNKIDKGEFN